MAIDKQIHDQIVSNKPISSIPVKELEQIVKSILPPSARELSKMYSSYTFS
jgi:hypothetical protein